MSGSAGWAIGVSLNLIGSIVLNVGTNFMKFGFIIRKQLELRQESSDAAAPLVGNKARTPRIWYVGVVLMVVGGVTVFGSLGFAPQSLLAPLGSIQFVSNVFLGRFLLKERVTSRTIFATCLLMLGSALSVVFGDHEHQEYTLRDLKALYTVGYVVFLIVLLSIAATLHYTFKRYHEYAVKGGPIPPPYHKYVYPLSYCNTSAIIGTQGAIFAKAASHIVSESARGNNQLQYPLSWVFIIGAICGSIFWLVRMNSALKMFDGLFIIPALQVCWIFWMILVGGTYYQEFESLQAWQICGFIISIGIIFTGVYLLVPSDSEEEMRRHSFHDPKLDERQLDTLEKAMGGGDMLQEVEMSSNIHTLREKTESVQNLENLDKERMDAITRYTNIVFNEYPHAVGRLVQSLSLGSVDDAKDEEANGEANGDAQVAPTSPVGLQLDSPTAHTGTDLV